MTKAPAKTLLPENTPSRFAVRAAVQEDRDAICRLFTRVFGEEMTPAHWQWKYGRSQSRAIVVHEEGELVAHYGGVGHEILLEGKHSAAIQITDLMIDKRARHAVRFASPFYLSAKRFLESFVGFEKPFLLAYGFPSDRAMTLSEKLGLYAPVGHMWEVRWHTRQPASASPGKVVAVNLENFARYEKKLDQLWERFGNRFGNHIVGLKDAAYFRWRYLAHPARHYSLHLILTHYTRRPTGLVAMRHDRGSSMLMDVLGESLQVEKGITAARQVAAACGNDVMTTWISESFRDVFVSEESEQKQLAIAIPANTCSNGPAVERQKNKWWLMPGDTDYQ